MAELAVLMATPALVTAGVLQFLRGHGRRNARWAAMVMILLGVAVGCGYLVGQVWSARIGTLVGVALATVGLAVGLGMRGYLRRPAGVGVIDG